MRRPPPRRPSQGGGGKKPAIGTWLVIGVGILGLLLIVRVGSRMLSGGEEGGPLSLSGATGATGSGTTYASPAPAGTRSSTFPTSVVGTRLQVKVIALGGDPPRCTAQALEVGGDLVNVYHHDCRGIDGPDRYFFAVQLTNLTNATVPVRLEGFAIRGPNGERPPYPAPPPGSSPDRFFPTTTDLAPGATIKRWITVNGGDGFRPEALVYHDGQESLVEAFEGTWAR